MVQTAKKTTQTTYEYDPDNGKVAKKTVVETEDVVTPTVTTVYPDNDTECNAELEVSGGIEVSPTESFLMAAIGAFLGNVLYEVIKKWCNTTSLSC